MNSRRKLLVALGASAIAAPLGSFAQQPGKVWRVGFLTPRSRPDSFDSDIFGAFRQGMRELGYVEGKNLVIEWRFADGKFERLPDLAAELVQMKVDIMVVGSTPAVGAAQKATATIPIVMGSIVDPVGSGFAKSLARPGGNITGLSNLIGDMGPKYLEMLISFKPKLSRVTVLLNPSNLSHAAVLKSTQAAAQGTGVKVSPAEVRSGRGIETAFTTMIKERVEGIIVMPDSLFLQQRHQITELAKRNRLPSISGTREYAEAGILMSYGPNFADNFRRAATYVDKIFKGANPGDLPVEQPTKFDLFINGKTAKALGLAIPQSLLIMANTIIE